MKKKSDLETIGNWLESNGFSEKAGYGSKKAFINYLIKVTEAERNLYHNSTDTLAVKAGDHIFNSNNFKKEEQLSFESLSQDFGPVNKKAI